MNFVRGVGVLGAVVALLSSVTHFPTASAGKRGALPHYKIGMAFRGFQPKEPYNWRGAQTHALRTVIWYPAEESATEQPVEIPGLSGLFVLGSAAQNAKVAPSPGRFPLILISHGTGGSGLGMSWLGAALASHGYIAAAVNHPGNNGAEPYSAEGFSTWWERARDLSVVIDFLLSDATFGSRIDQKRIGAAGFSLGGYTMIEIAGGITDVPAFLKYCDSPKADGICKSPPEFPTLVEDFRKLVQSNPQFLSHAGDSYRDPRVRAVFAMAPALGPAFPASGLAKIAVPVKIVAGESDENVPVASGAKYFADNIPGAELKLFPPHVGHYVFLDSCQPGASPMICVDGAGVDRGAIHTETIQLAVAFFGATLK